MSQDASSEVDDESLVLRMLDGDEGALRLLIETHGPKIRGALKKKYRGILAEPEIDAAMNWAAFNVYRSIGDYDVTRSSLRSWFYVIALRAAQDILKGENRNKHDGLDFDPFEEHARHASDGDDGQPSNSSKQERALHEAIEKGLTSGERAVVLADLAADGEADSARLASERGSTVGSVHALRSKARSKIRKSLIEQGHFQDPQRSRR